MSTSARLLAILLALGSGPAAAVALPPSSSAMTRIRTFIAPPFCPTCGRQIPPASAGDQDGQSSPQLPLSRKRGDREETGGPGILKSHQLPWRRL